MTAIWTMNRAKVQRWFDSCAHLLVVLPANTEPPSSPGWTHCRLLGCEFLGLPLRQELFLYVLSKAESNKRPACELVLARMIADQMLCNI